MVTLPSCRLDHFLHHHRVRACRHHRAGGDAHALPGAYAAAEGLPGERGADLLEDRVAGAEVRKAHRVAVHRGVVVARHVDRGHDVLGEHAAERLAHRQALRLRHRHEAGTDRRARLLHVQRIGVVALDGVDDFDNPSHASFNSAIVLMLRKAFASSSNGTSTTLRLAYQASILRPPPARKADRCASTARRTSENTGCG